MKSARIVSTQHGHLTFVVHGRRQTFCHVVTPEQLAGRIQNACVAINKQHRQLTPPAIAAKVMTALRRTDRKKHADRRWCGTAPCGHTKQGIMVVASPQGLLVRPTKKVLSKYLKKVFPDHKRNHVLLAAVVTNLVYGAASQVLGIHN